MNWEIRYFCYGMRILKLSFWKNVNVYWLILVAVLFGLNGGVVRAQEEEMFENRTFYGGVILGGNLCQVDGDNFAGYNKKGITTGAVVYMKLYKKAIGSLELLYSQKGSVAAKAEMLPSGLTIMKYGIDLNYAEVPVMINFFDKHRSHLSFGASYSQLSRSNEYVTAYPALAYDQDKHPFNKSDINVIAGGTLRLYKGLFFNLRFQYSVVPIRAQVADISRGPLYNNLWSLRLMYLFM